VPGAISRDPSDLEGRDGRALPNTVDEIARVPSHGYIAVIGGDTHNYQRYPVAAESTDGGRRIIQYIVSGGGGAFTHGTHTMDKIACDNLGGPAFRPIEEHDVVLYPRRGDSLAFYSWLFARKARRPLGWWLWLYLRLRGAGSGEIERDVARRMMSLKYEIPVRELEHITPTRRDWAAERVISALPSGRLKRLGQAYFPYWDTDDPPFFKSFLRVDVDAREVRIRCYGVTGGAAHEVDPPLEDEVTWNVERGAWTNGAPA
jgi:hypothetical protein